ncbi:ribosomal protein S6 kinase-like 1 [Polyodon spathula]|uniref:ribosomal protein S6 kinase-like 1 n=1 Tax=Polyodon spathula TaxID=7913 RepID=UPI001B7E50FE|nr:ribosomal protein S6 kinase-like 1 [Polyodon spathula]XP_041131065.1 ribosomal protein S6 kinase-like 1 [Polyodon spathula]
MHQVLGEPQDADPRGRAVYQARLYLEQIRSQVSASRQDVKLTMAKRDYLVDAAKQIRMALDREISEDYEAAFNYYKNGVDLLLKGVQVDPNKERREAVKRKTTQYLKRAEEIFNLHLQGSLGSADSKSRSQGFSSLRFQPVRTLSSPVEDLKMYKVTGVIDKVLMVQNPTTKEVFVVKILPKSSWKSREYQTIIPQGVPFMVRLLRYSVSEDSVFLHLEHIQGVRLFSQIHKASAERVKEYPKCCSPSRRKIKLKNSYTAPTLRFDFEESNRTPPNKMTGITEDLVHCSDTEPQTEGQSEGFNAGDAGCLLCSKHNEMNEHSQHCLCSECYTGMVMKTDFIPANSKVQFLRNQSNLLESQEYIAHQPDVNTRDKPDGAPKVAPSNLISTESCIEFNKYKTVNSNHLANEVPQTTETSVQNSGSEAACESQLVCESVTLKLEEDFSDPPVQTWMESGRGALATEGTSKGSSTARRPGAVAGQYLTVHDEEGGEDLSNTAANQQKRTEGSIERLAPIRVDSSNVDSAGIMIGASSGNGQGLMKLPIHNAAYQVWTDQDPAIPSVKDPQVTSTKVKGWEEEENWELLSPLNRESGAFPVTGQVEVLPFDSRGAGSKASPLRKNGYCSNSLSPASDLHIEVDGWCLLPKQGPRGLSEDQARLWVAQILLALESLHEQGIVCRDLNPRNLLLDSCGRVRLTYFGQWVEVQSQTSSKAVEDMYCAPEVGGVCEVTEACDWWSLGALLYELLTGMSLKQCHPSGILPHTQLHLPDYLSTAAASLLTELLQFDAGYRLGSGGGGVSDIKGHPFFSTIPWQKLSG